MKQEYDSCNLLERELETNRNKKYKDIIYHGYYLIFVLRQLLKISFVLTSQ